MDFVKDFLKGLAGALVAAASVYLQNGDYSKLGIWAAVGGAVAALLAMGLAKLRDKLLS